MLSRPRSLARQRGLSLVELMVGVTIGLFVVAAASTLVATQLLDNRHLIAETQLQQDMRATADIITRELRRAGTEGLSNARLAAWYAGSTGARCNLYATVQPDTAAADAVSYRYYRSSNQIGPLGFKLDGGVVKYSLTTNVGPDATTCSPANDPGNWQELTDPHTVTITGFSITPVLGPAMVLSCPKLCPDGTTSCWPTIRVRDLVVTLQGQSVIDATVNRSITSTVRLRNDYVQFRNTAAPLQACPA